MVERQVPAYNRLKTDCVASRSVWLRTRTAGGVRGDVPMGVTYSISDFCLSFTVIFRQKVKPPSKKRSSNSIQNCHRSPKGFDLKLTRLVIQYGSLEHSE
jgi:hypothetical protein